MATLRLFASAREAAGIGRDDIPGATVGEVLAGATVRYGDRFSTVLESCRVWVNGDAATNGTVISETDEVAVLPPVSGGALDDRPAPVRLAVAEAADRGEHERL